MILGAFGDSFTFGSDLKDCTDSQHSRLTWPSLVASNLNLEYRCLAQGGVGNRFIFNQILEHIHNDWIFIINWTWIDRFDYTDSISRDWHTTRPSLDNYKIDSFYYKNFHSEQMDKLNSLGFIYQTINLLEKYNKKYLMTYMDKLLLDSEFNSSKGIRLLQSECFPKLHSMSDMTFLEWAKFNNYPISESYHPLEPAHEKAAEYWLPYVRTLLNTQSKGENNETE
jgi:hypothetical protein